MELYDIYYIFPRRIYSEMTTIHKRILRRIKSINNPPTISFES